MSEYFPEENLHEECGIFAVDRIANAGYAAMRAAVDLNHRGQEGAGLVTHDGANFYFAGNGGLVREILTTERLAGMPGTRSMTQTRYGTSGTLGATNIQPIKPFEGLDLYFAENGNQTNDSPLRSYLIEHGDTEEDLAGLNDSGLKARVLGRAVLGGLKPDAATEKVYSLFTGAFSFVMMNADMTVAVRGPHGVRPLVLGRKGENGWMVASETCAIEAAGGTVERDLEPDEMLVITKDGLESRRLGDSKLKTDIFEAVYFANPRSRMFNKSVYRIRQDMGTNLAAEHPAEADIVIPVPNSAIPAAIGYSRATGIPFEMALHKNPYIHRTFIEPTEELRREARAMKINAIRDVVEGKRVVVIDDSIVRGGTQEDTVELLYAAGATEVHVRITSPEIIFPDFYGINTPEQQELAYWKYGGVEGIRRHIKATTLGYLSLDGMVAATGQPKDRFCLSAFTGEYPISIGEREKELVRP